jgi:hypothetical protein
MRAFSIAAILGMIALLVSACSPIGAGTAAAPALGEESEMNYRYGGGPNGDAPIRQRVANGWISPDAKTKQLLYASDVVTNEVDIFSVPGYLLVGQVTDGLDGPEGIATDEHGDLYVSSQSGVTIYAKGKTKPKLILTDKYGADDVAVTKNGFVVAGDVNGGVEVYAPGQKLPKARLVNSALSSGVSGVAVDEDNDIFAAGLNASLISEVVEFAKLSGSGTNLNLAKLTDAAGVLIDKYDDLVVSDFVKPNVRIYREGKSVPKTTFGAKESPDRSALDRNENLIYVPEGHYGVVRIFDYPSGTYVSDIVFPGSYNFISGTALTPAPKP